MSALESFNTLKIKVYSRRLKLYMYSLIKKSVIKFYRPTNKSEEIKTRDRLLPPPNIYIYFARKQRTNLPELWVKV